MKDETDVHSFVEVLLGERLPKPLDDCSFSFFLDRGASVPKVPCVLFSSVCLGLVTLKVFQVRPAAAAIFWRISSAKLLKILHL
ncbi:unnamed protein product [Caenorhabditis auriculariae]|uniref:Uncharacterized protein n=1 Tax=Caenorhabditis auriculariae TaxID=2777116 RepID=A0A8S1H166_9PELO|nr:unnamed protein product [Caenorhabditis auriculariae]